MTRPNVEPVIVLDTRPAGTVCWRVDAAVTSDNAVDVTFAAAAGPRVHLVLAAADAINLAGLLSTASRLTGAGLLITPTGVSQL